MSGCAGGDANSDFFGPLFGTHPVEVAAPAPARPAPVVVAPATATETPPAKPRPPAAKRPADRQTAAAAAPAPADLSAPPLKLVGLTQAETVSLLGAPSSQWDRPPARVWHYQGPDCAIDVFFYLDVSRNEFSALRFTAAGADGGAASGQLCLNRIHDAQRK